VLALSRPALADNESACGTVLCLAGEAIGQGGSGCAGYLASYFSIRVFKGGDFKPGDTESARGNYLNQCSSADSGTRSSLNSQFGRQELGP
jgi:hypothetical protein